MALRDFSLCGKGLRDSMTWSMRLRSRRAGHERATNILWGKRRACLRFSPGGHANSVASLPFIPLRGTGSRISSTGMRDNILVKESPSKPVL